MKNGHLLKNVRFLLSSFFFPLSSCAAIRNGALFFRNDLRVGEIVVVRADRHRAPIAPGGNIYLFQRRAFREREVADGGDYAETVHAP